MNLTAYHAILNRLHVEPAETDPSCRTKVADLLDMPLPSFAQEGHLLEVQVPFFAETLWFVPSEADARRLTREGISRGRIWTAQELEGLLSRADLSSDYVKAGAIAKIEHGGDHAGR